VVRNAPLVALTLALMVLAKGALTTGVSRLLGAPLRPAVLVGAALAQSGEFSFLLARVGSGLGVVSTEVFNLMLSAAAMSILFSPLLNRLAPGALRWVQRRRALPAMADFHGPSASGGTALHDHAIVCGYGRVGRVVCALLERHQIPFVVVEEDLRTALSLRARGVRVFIGDAAHPHLLERAGLEAARLLVLCIPERMGVRRVVDHVRLTNPALPILARTHSERERRVLVQRGVNEPVLGERELALAMARRALERFDIHVERGVLAEELPEDPPADAPLPSRTRS
jgi:monovalent cation:H+ antiporter-2, CPA2 family